MCFLLQFLLYLDATESPTAAFQYSDSRLQGFWDPLFGHDTATRNCCQKKHETDTDILPLRNRMHLHIIYALQYM